MLKRGSKNAVFVRGDYKPAKLYKGTQLVAGWSPVTKAAPCAWDGTYNDVLDVALTGKGEQNGTPTPDAPVPLAASECALTSKNADGSKSSTIAKSNALRKIPNSNVEDTYVVNGDGTVTITRNVKVVQLVGTENWGAASSPYVDADGNTVGQMYFVWSSEIGEYNWNVYRWCDRYSCYPNESYTVGVSLRPMPDTGYGVYTNNTGYPSLVCFLVPSADYASVSAWTNYLKAQNAAGTTVTLWVRAATTETETMSIADFTQGSPATISLRGLPATEIRDTAEYTGNGVWTLKRNITEMVFDGTESWYVGNWDNAETGRFFRLFLGTQTVLQSNGVCRCSHLAGKSWSNFYWSKPNDAIAIDNQGSDFIGVRWSGATEDGEESKTLWTAFLKQQLAAGTPVTIWYQRETPVTETLALGELKTYPGYTALEVSGDFLPEVTAGAKVADTEPET